MGLGGWSAPSRCCDLMEDPAPGGRRAGWDENPWNIPPPGWLELSGHGSSAVSPGASVRLVDLRLGQGQFARITHWWQGVTDAPAGWDRLVWSLLVDDEPIPQYAAVRDQIAPPAVAVVGLKVAVELARISVRVSHDGGDSVTYNAYSRIYGWRFRSVLAEGW